MLLLVDHEKKIVYPIDLKTSYKPEWDFFKSFSEWRYDLQARLYWRIIRDNMDRSPVFKDYTLADYKFIVVNKNTLTPLVWEFTDTKKYGTLHYGKDRQIEMRDPYDIGVELYSYLSSRPDVPMGIKKDTHNDLIGWLNIV